jgi:hypothetical protein
MAGQKEMSRLTACFTIPLAQCFYAKGEEREFLYKTTIDDFDIEIRLPPEELGRKCKPANDSEFTYCITELIVRVSKTLVDDIPPVIITGVTQDYTLRAKFFMENSDQFRKVAEASLRKVIRYFKFKLHQPLLEEFPDYRQCFYTPIWRDENGNEIRTGWEIFSETPRPGMSSYDFGVAKLTTANDPELGRAIEEEIVPELYEEILSDAQSAIFQENNRRAVLELAMACELMIKQTYFAKSTTAGRAYEFMEDRQKVSMNITDYIDGVAGYAFGETFEQATSKTDFMNIQHLFRGRNKIVHRGELIFRDDRGLTHPIDRITLKKWWASVERLLSWLNSKRS